MGFAFIIFVALFASVLVIATAAVYGAAKDSQKAPLKALNDYAGIKTDQAHTRITINATCLAGTGPYTNVKNNGGPGPYTLWLTDLNNGSTVLNPKNSTILFNLSYFTFSVTAGVGSSTPFGNVWTPLNKTNMSVPNIMIYNLNYPYRLMVAAANGVTAVAPTTPTNFSGWIDSTNSSYFFSWNASTDAAGVAYYLIYDSKNPGSCPNDINANQIFQVPGSITSSDLFALYGWNDTCTGGSCPNTNFFITAVDNLGNMGVQSVTINCNPPQSNTKNPCTEGTV